MRISGRTGIFHYLMYSSPILIFSNRPPRALPRGGEMRPARTNLSNSAYSIFAIAQWNYPWLFIVWAFYSIFSENKSCTIWIARYNYRITMKIFLNIHCLTIFILFGTLFYPLFTHINSVCNLPLISFTVYSLRNLKNPYMFSLLYSNLKSKSYILMQ